MPKFTKKTRHEYVSGKLSWVRVVKPDLGYEPAWTATIYPNTESLEKIREWQTEGLKNVLKKNDDGYYTRFKCLVSRPRKDGTVWTFEPPTVIDKDGRPMDGNIIGNGSDGTLKLEVYEHNTPGGGKAIAARLVGVRVDSLVEFNPDSDYAEGEDTTQELRAQKSALF
jgi:hypothetical protein